MLTKIEGKTDQDWLWTYVIDGMKYTPDEAIFNILQGEDIATIQVIRKPKLPCSRVFAKFRGNKIGGILYRLFYYTPVFIMRLFLALFCGIAFLIRPKTLHRIYRCSF